MLVKEENQRVILPKGHPIAQTIRLLVKVFQRERTEKKEADAVPTRMDIRKLWREIDEPHKQILRTIAEKPMISQADLEAAIGESVAVLRGRNIGLSKICNRLSVQYPIHQAGYNRSNRTFFLEPDVAKTVKELAKKGT